MIFASRVVLSHKDPMVCCHHFNWASAVTSVVAIVNGMIVILLYHAHSNNNGRGQKPLKPGYPKVCKVQAELAMCRRFVNPSRSQVLTNEWNHFQRSHLAWVGGSSFVCVWCVWKGWPELQWFHSKINHACVIWKVPKFEHLHFLFSMMDRWNVWFLTETTCKK